MTREEARRLMSGYATGSLTDAEKRSLMEAALEDQDLFNELACEQEFKDILDAPGVNQRLIRALGRSKPVRAFAPMWLWTAAAVTALAIAVTTWQFIRAPKPAQMAQAIPAPAVEQAKPIVAEPVAPAEKKAEKKVEKKVRKPKAQAPGEAQPPVAIQARPAPGSAPVQARSQAFLPRAGRAPARFSFDYSLDGDNLVLKFNADGWLYLHFSPGADTIEHAHVTAGETRREPIPNNATEATIIYSAGAQTDAALGVQLTRSDRAGTVADPAGNRIEFLLKFY